MTGTDAAQAFYDEHVHKKHTENGVAEADAAEAVAAAKDGSAVFVDARSADAQKISKMKGAMTPEEFLKAAEAGDEKVKGKKVYSYCWLGGDSCDFIKGKKDKLKELGYEDAKSVKLGMIGIAGADPELIVDSSGAVTKEVHNVEPIKGMFPEGFHENL